MRKLYVEGVRRRAENSRMEHDARIDLRIPRDWRVKFDACAEELGLSPSDLGRLLIRQFLQRRNLSVRMENSDDQAPR